MNKRICITYEELFFLMFFSLITFGKSIGLGAENNFLRIITITAFLSLIVKLFISKYTFNEFIICFFLILIGLGTYLVTKREGILLSILTLIGLKNIEYKKVFLIAFIIRLFAFLSTISLAMIGVIENNKIVHWRDGTGFIFRYGLGYSHPNLLHSTFFIIVVLFLYLYYEKINVLNCSIIVMLNLFIYSCAGSRTGYYLIIFSVILSIVSKINRQKTKYLIYRLIIPFCLAFTFITSILYGKYEIINKLDSLFSGRIYYTSYFFKNYSMSLLGNNLYLDNNLIDNSYIILLANYGLIIFILYILSYQKIINYFIASKKNKELVMISLFSIYGITEGFLSNIFMNLSMVYIGDIIFRSKINTKEKLCN